MSFFQQVKKWFHKNRTKNKSENNTLDSIRVPKRYEGYKIVKMLDLTKDLHTYWKFTQSEPGLSQEEHFAKYEIGNIETAVDEDEWLSFVKDENIGNCIGYGDRLAKLCFKKTDQQFRKIANDPVIKKENFIGEMTARRLIPEEHFELENPETIVKIISLSNTRAIITLFHHPLSDLETVLEHYNFKKSLNFVQYIKRQYPFENIENINKLKENSYSILDNWKRISKN